MKASNYILTIILALCISVQGFSNSSLDSAKTFYDKGQFAEAQKIYENMLQKQPKNFELYYNLGNCYFKTGNTGLAILSYEKALQIKANDEDTKHNLVFLQTQLVDKFDAVPSADLSTLFQKINALINYNLIGIIGLLLLILSGILIFLKKRKQQKVNFSESWLLMLLSAFLFLWAFVQQKNIEPNKNAIILAYESKIVSAPNNNAVLIFKLHEGTKLKIIESQAEWLNIKAPDGTVGWIKKEDIGTY